MNSVTPMRRIRGTTRASRARDNGDPRSTRDKILDAAESVFADKGYNGASTRDIAAAADANLGMIPYYFGSKENLLKEVIRRRAVPELEERAAAVSAVLAEAGNGKPDIAAILRADLEPQFRRRRENAVHRRLAGRISTDPSPEVRRVVNEIYCREALVFDLALRRACPHLSDEEFYWRFYCVFGAVQYVLADVGKIQTLAGPGFSTSDPEVALTFVVRFLEAALRAPAVGGTSEIHSPAAQRTRSLTSRKAQSRSRT
jgi:AcrR family transcriptional regulator